MALRKKEEVIKLAHDFMDFCNDFNPDKETFVAAMMDSHRTLQQTAFGVVLAIIREFAKQDETKNYDDRNEASIKLAKRIIDHFKDDLYLPTI